MNKIWHLEDFGFQNKDFVTLITWIILYRWSNVLSKELEMLFESFSDHAGMIKQKNDIKYLNWSYMDIRRMPKKKKKKKVFEKKTSPVVSDISGLQYR